LLAQFSKNLTNKYNNIINSINILISSFRNEENERLPRITNSLNELVKDIDLLKSKSEFITKEMLLFEEIIKTFQNKINDASSQIISTFNEVIDIFIIIYHNLLLINLFIYYRI
jgi:small-conductance mechanosensitive channel